MLTTPVNPTGLILSGGLSSRMGANKALLSFQGQSFYKYMHALLTPFCDQVYLSCRPEQKNLFVDIPLILDEKEGIGPIAGLMAAWNNYPKNPLLVVGVDMPRMGAEIIENLILAREPQLQLTGYAQLGAQFVEPLCTIYEPSFHSFLLQNAPGFKYSLSKLIQMVPDKKVIFLEDMSPFQSVNTLEDWEDFIR